MRLRYRLSITLAHFFILVFSWLFLILVSCQAEVIEDTSPYSSENRFDNTIVFDGELEVSDFVWKSLNYYYYWQEEVPLLADSKAENEEAYYQFILQNKDPEKLFESLIHEDDRFSWIQDDYRELENSIQGIIASNGVEFGLLYACQSCRQLIGFVKYIIEGSDASTKDIRRGDLFSGVNGTQLTVENYRELLFSDNLNYTLNMISIRNGVITSNGKEVALQKEENFAVNPIQMSKVMETSSGKVGYLMYNQFVADKSSLLNQIFVDFKNEGISDLIIDLRYNGGGSIQNCVYLASMITGQFPGQIFVKEEWNLKMSNYLSSEFGKESFVERFISKLPSGESLNSLSLDRVYVLTSSETASASELLINGLRSFIEVIQIGEKTVGKNVGSITVYDYINKSQTKNPNHTYALQPIVLKIANNDGFADYSDGLEPNFTIQERIDDFGTLGDPEELLLSTALSIIRGDTIVSPQKKSFLFQRRVQDPLLLNRQRMHVDKKINLGKLDEYFK